MERIDINFLKEEFQNARKEIADSEFYTDILKRKYTHSVRVWKNGIRIINHDIPQLLKHPKLEQQFEFALFFHDIGRFRENVNICKDEQQNKPKNHYDHCVLGAEILAQSKDYNDIKIVLAVRHHGHLIEEFYNDADFKNLSKLKQKEAETMIKVLRDADKLDLFYWQKYHNLIENDLIFHTMSEERKFGPASPEVIEQLLSQSPIDHNLMKTFSDRILGCAAWKFDFNYPFTMQIYKQENYQQ